ncbi:MAG: hypothetical protein ACPGJS_14970 [Flammeovirgaceae bacterium]
MNLKMIGFTVACVLLCLSSFAQTDSLRHKKHKKRHFVFGLGMNYFNLKDDAMSPVRYTGSSFVFNLGTQKETSKWLSRVDFSLNAGALRSMYYEETERGKTLNLRMDLAYSRLQKIKTLGKSNVEWLLGGSVDTQAALRLHNQLDNSSGVYDSFTSLSASTAFRKSFEWKKRQFQFSYQASIPFVTVVLRPSFNGLFNFVDPESDFFQENLDRHGFASFGSYFRLNNRYELAYWTRGGQNQIRLGYQWDILRYQKLHQLVMAKHQFYLSSLFYF